MNKALSALPSYIKESPQYFDFLKRVSDYILTGAEAMSAMKDEFLLTDKSRFVLDTLSAQLGLSIDVPFIDGKPDWDTYYRQLLFAYYARVFNSSFKGTYAELLENYPLRDISTFEVLDFSVAKTPVPMSVVYSVLSSDPNLTLDLVRSVLVPRITGVQASLYYLLYGQSVFGYDLDEEEGLKIVGDLGGGSYSVEAKFPAILSTISSLGTGYVVGDEVSANGVLLKIEELSENALLLLLEPGKLYSTDPAGDDLVVTGGSGTGMRVNISSTGAAGYSVRGYDSGKFLPTSQRRSSE